MMAYVGCALFGLIFLVLSAKSGGTVGIKTGHMVEWARAWAPYSYLIFLVMAVAAMASLHITVSWPKHQEPEDPMAKYRHAQDDVMED